MQSAAASQPKACIRVASTSCLSRLCTLVIFAPWCVCTLVYLCSRHFLLVRPLTLRAFLVRGLLTLVRPWPISEQALCTLGVSISSWLLSTLPMSATAFLYPWRIPTQVCSYIWRLYTLWRICTLVCFYKCCLPVRLLTLELSCTMRFFLASLRVNCRISLPVVSL